jgi:hypothetical protein
MPITTRDIANIGSPPADPTCLLPGKLYVPDPEVFPGPWDCVVGTVAGHFTVHQNLQPLDRPFRDLAEQGFLCLAFYVRLLDPIPTQTTTGEYPQQTDDFKLGIEFMRSDPGGFGYQVTGWVAALGGSGSAHHALFCALDGVAGVDQADAAICMSPATDFSDRESDVLQQFIDKTTAYAGVTDLPTLLARSPIALINLDNPQQPILHYNWDNEAMPLSQLTRFRDAMADVVNYQSRINTGQLGQVHSFAMWPQIKAEAIAWLFSVSGVTPPEPIPEPVPPSAPAVMPREGVFRRIFNRVILRLGRDPYKQLPYELSRAVVEHINQRADTICKVWSWPEWEVTEERAFRPIWNATHQWLRTGANGRPDEVFYLPNLTYYKAEGTSASDPPVGSLPTNETYWTELESIDTFIAYDQTCKRTIGQVLGVYSQNPRVPTGSMNGVMKFMPSEKGIDVLHPGNPTVFLTYKLPVPRYTMTPIAFGYPYRKGDIVFDPFEGDCFQAVSDNNGLPVTDASAWRRITFPERWRNYVVEGAFADSLCELDQGGNEYVATNLALAAQANQKADMLLQLEVDSLAVQGQRLPWNWCVQHGYWCESLPWAGGSVTTLTDECEDDITQPAPRTAIGVIWRYYQDIIALLTEDGTPSLQQVVTTTQAVGSKAEFTLVADGSRQAKEAYLEDGPADPDDLGHVTPEDYNVDTNNKHWEVIG